MRDTTRIEMAERPRLAVSFDPDDLAGVEHLAAQRRCSAASVVRAAVADYVERQAHVERAARMTDAELDRALLGLDGVAARAA